MSSWKYRSVLYFFNSTSLIMKNGKWFYSLFFVIPVLIILVIIKICSTFGFGTGNGTIERSSGFHCGFYELKNQQISVLEEPNLFKYLTKKVDSVACQNDTLFYVINKEYFFIEPKSDSISKIKYEQLPKSMYFYFSSVNVYSQ